MPKHYEAPPVDLSNASKVDWGRIRWGIGLLLAVSDVVCKLSNATNGITEAHTHTHTNSALFVAAAKRLGNMQMVLCHSVTAIGIGVTHIHMHTWLKLFPCSCMLTRSMCVCGSSGLFVQELGTQLQKCPGEGGCTCCQGRSRDWCHCCSRF